MKFFVLIHGRSGDRVAIYVAQDEKELDKILRKEGLNYEIITEKQYSDFLAGSSGRVIVDKAPFLVTVRDQKEKIENRFDALLKILDLI